MNNDLLRMPTSKLQRVLALKKQIERLQAQLEKLVLGSGADTGAKTKKPRKKMSASARKRIAAAKTAWWAEKKAKAGRK